MVQDKEACMQFIQYAGLAYDKYFKHNPYGIYHPMDIDSIYCFVQEKHREMYFKSCTLFYEFKKGNAQMSIGEKITYETLSNAVNDTGGFAIVAEVHHDDDVKDGDIQGADGLVTRIYLASSREWRELKKPITAGMFTDIFMEFVGLRDKGGE